MAFFFLLGARLGPEDTEADGDEDEKSKRQDLAIGRTTEINYLRCVLQRAQGLRRLSTAKMSFHRLGKSREVNVTAPSSTSRGPPSGEEYVK